MAWSRRSRGTGWWRRPALAVALAAALAVAALSGARLADSLLRWSESDAAIEPWMTVGSVAHSRGIDREALARALGVTPTPGRRLTLGEVAEMTGRSWPEVKAIVEGAIAEPERPAR